MRVNPLFVTTCGTAPLGQARPLRLGAGRMPDALRASDSEAGESLQALSSGDDFAASQRAPRAFVTLHNF